ncbi:TetR/AcrR family transcriptional regulator [Streptomyces coelicoflavus]|uniref:TetR/AcrR family transcriptional regulator n=1 Tax=Streptomyces coelicoflavus TaxID=285562 RepID=A0A6N9UGS3_9ACTN|nr:MULTISPECIES: TetR/AcrR family transcriptional regulator [Streptomyces]EHN75400.1 TetR family transcriptional regulator [Streptomyces coelicoflavus ZG0656]KPC71833.1 TetR family transcriptional regulator [Streptomyces sp. NRRL WC-3753]MZE44717.1 TetR family transcriptional regulator [Streptomyces sp. SID5477]NEB15886.1 TetR/AcrR family transcriptional regulator [Streptomyces coelicoflavus]OWA18080.1 TetR family transcriptional regulator [Streptomyces sp. CS159]
MSPKPMVRPGGRSARVQESVHATVRALVGEVGRDALTVPMVAARAGVTPSTIYRRWGDLQELLSDVAVERLRPEADPADLGSLRADLDAWAEQFVDEMASPPGRAYIRDALLGDPDGTNAGRCSAYAAEQIDVVLARAVQRGEPVPETELLIDRVVAPIMYRILFRPGRLDAAYARELVTNAVCAQQAEAGARPTRAAAPRRSKKKPDN